MEYWYALYTKPRQEARVTSHLEERGLQVFCPRYVERRRGQAPKVRPLFPCYAFIRIDLDVLGLSALQWTPGLRGIVAFAGAPARVPEEAMQLVRRRVLELEDQSLYPASRFKPGERVRIKEGPLTGLEAVFEESVGAEDRVRILIKFLGEANRAVVPAEVLEAAPAPVPQEQHPPRRTRGKGRWIEGQKPGNRE